MTDTRQIAADLSDAERAVLLSLAGEAAGATVPQRVAEQLRGRGLAVFRPDGHADLSDTGWRVLDLIREP